MMHGGWWSGISSADEKPKVTRKLLLRVLAYARPYHWKMLATLGLILATTGLGLVGPLIFRQLIDKIIPSGNLRSLAGMSLALLLIPVTSGILSVFQRRLNSQIGEGVIYDLRVSLYAHLQRMSLRFFTNTKVGELMSRLNNDVVGAQNAISNILVGIITNILQTIAVLGVMLRLEWRLTLISAIILPLFILAARRMGVQLRDIARQQMDYNAQMNAMMNETLNIGGALLVKLFGRNAVEVERFRSRAARVRDTGIRQAVVASQFFVMIGLVSAIGTALVYGIGGYLVIQEDFSIGTIVAFGSYLSTLYGALQALANAPVAFATSVVSFERVFEVIDLPMDIPENPAPIELKDTRGELVFDQVTFQYQAHETSLLSQVRRYGQMHNVTAVLSGENAAPTEKNGDQARSRPTSPQPESREEDDGTNSQARPVALEEISFHVEPGQLVALVGPSGAGKTTLTYLIPRLYDPSVGRILLDGVDLRNASLSSLSAQIGMVTQETHLFHDSIRTNLLYARLDATQAEVEAAARTANIHEFIHDLPDGYDTIVGERGYRLSGGEKQRIALARVILKNPRVLVLDEATSHLDSESESLIQEALKHVMAGRTSIVIAHRLSTILAADLILVLDRGRIVERGSHAELLAAGGLYAHLYQTQFSQSSRPEVI